MRHQLDQSPRFANKFSPGIYFGHASEETVWAFVGTYFMTHVTRGDGEINWSRSSGYWDHHAGESSVCVGTHYYGDPHEWPAAFQRDFELTLNYTVDEESP